MARELSVTLEAQQKLGLITHPYVQARITKKWGNVIRYDWDSVYSGEEDDYLHTATMPGDGSLIRLRVTLPGDSRKLYYQRVTSPTPESDFSEWTYLSIYNVIAVASCASGDNVAQFYINDDKEIHFRESTDNGANWGAWSLIDYTAVEPDVYCDAAYGNNSDIALVWAEVNIVVRKRRLSDVWQSSEENPWPLNHVSGISIYHNDDWNIIGTRQGEVGPPEVTKGVFFTRIQDPGTTWRAWEAIMERSQSEPFEYYNPNVRRPDTTRFYFREKHTQEDITNHIFYSHMPPSAAFIDNAWLEPVPTQPQSQYGLALCQLGSYAWLSNANTVYRALSTEDELVLTARLLEIDSRDYPDIFKGSLKVVIDNTGGWYDDFDRLGQQLEVGIGYVTSEGNEYSLLPFRWITKFKLVAPPWYPLRMIWPQGVVGTLKIETEDAWTFLYRYRTRRTLSWGEGVKTVKELLHFFIARCGLDFDVISQSDAVQNFRPAFEVRTGTSYRTAIKNLLKMVPDQLVFRDAKVLLRNPTTAEAVDWTYHTTLNTALLVFRGEYGETAINPNRAEVWSDTFMKQAANWPQIEMVRERLSRVSTPTYPDTTRAGERADAELRRSEILTGEESVMFAPTNCGLEPWDVLQITDANAGVSAVRRRVRRIKAYWNARHWQYQQTISMGSD